MKFAGVLTVPGLGLTSVVEVEIPGLDGIATAAGASDVLDDAALRLRWKCSGRTTKRIRDQRRLRYSQPSPRIFVYSLDDVRAYEASTHRGAHRRIGRAS